MTIDNFDLIADIIRKKNLYQGDFFFLQIIRRRKENPDQTSHSQNVDNFFIKDADDLVKMQSRIIEKCDLENARAYIRLNKRSQKKVALQTLALVAQNIASENYDIKNCYLSCCGQFHSDEDKTWLIDIDNDKNIDVESLISIIRPHIVDAGKDSTVIKIPTKNGVHLICRPFNLQYARTDMLGSIDFSKIDIHKDNPTILYIP